MEPSISAGDHKSYMSYCLTLAQKSPPKPTNYRVGALLLDDSSNTILATGYTLELPGNTHAEQCCFLKLLKQHNLPHDSEDRLAEVLPQNTVLYTTVEPCGMRLSGNLPCVERILKVAKGGEGKGGIKKVYVGVKEPEKFVGANVGRQKLEGAGIEVVLVEGLEEEILKVATAGHVENKA